MIQVFRSGIAGPDGGGPDSRSISASSSRRTDPPGIQQQQYHAPLPLRHRYLPSRLGARLMSRAGGS